MIDFDELLAEKVRLRRAVGNLPQRDRVAGNDSAVGAAAELGDLAAIDLIRSIGDRFNLYHPRDYPSVEEHILMALINAGRYDLVHDLIDDYQGAKFDRNLRLRAILIGDPGLTADIRRLYGK